MSDAAEMTGAEADLNAERQLQIALRCMVDRGGAADIKQIYEAIQHHMPHGVTLSQQGKDTLRAYVNRTAKEKGWVEPFDPEDGRWRITPEGRAYLDEVEPDLGVELENEIPGEIEDNVSENKPLVSEGTVSRLFDASAIRVDQRTISVFQVMRRISRGEIDMKPEFKRNVVWNNTRQSRLIESILLRIPLPPIYLDATPDDIWLVVDGLQRLSTLQRFFSEQSLVLENLEYLIDLNGKTFNDLPRALQRRLEDAELNLYIIRPETPPKVKFMIFTRVNTGDLVLTPQEIRHALFQGRATTFLAELAEDPAFLTATSRSVSSLRMDDRECVLRFLAFQMNDYERYGRADQRDKNGRPGPQNLDEFLSEAMEQLNRMDEGELASLRDSFRGAMVRAHRVFGAYAFRKMYKRGGRRNQISKPLFEVWSVLLLRYEIEALERRKDAIIDAFVELMKSVEFNKSISLGTGSASAVIHRFRAVEALLAEVTG